MRSRLLILSLVVGLLLTALPVLAHHSTTMYNMTNPVTVTGVVKRFDWANPHAHIYLDVKDEQGNMVEWDIEMMSLNHLKGYGWSRNTVQPGDLVSCTGGAAKSGLPAMLSSLVKLADGRVIKS
jgi:hypothetical protein